MTADSEIYLLKHIKLGQALTKQKVQQYCHLFLVHGPYIDRHKFSTIQTSGQ